MSNFSTVLFDLDGTLTDSGRGIVNSVEYALKKFNITNYNRENLFSFIGPPLIESFMQNFGFTREKANKALVCYREYYTDKGIFENELYPGIVPLLKALKDAEIKVALATSKPEKFAKQILKYFDIYKYFDFLIGADMDEKSCEKSQIIANALKRVGITPSDKIAMVGDRRYDIEGAIKNKITPIAVTYGYGDFEELKNSGAEIFADTAEELLKILL